MTYNILADEHEQAALIKTNAGYSFVFGHRPNGFVYGKYAVQVENGDIVVKPASRLPEIKSPSHLKPMEEIKFPLKTEPN